MPKLYDWLVADLNVNDLTVTTGIQHSGFTLMDRQRLKNWQRRFYDEIESVRDFLLPQAKSRRPKSDQKPANPVV